MTILNFKSFVALCAPQCLPDLQVGHYLFALWVKIPHPVARGHSSCFALPYITLEFSTPKAKANMSVDVDSFIDALTNEHVKAALTSSCTTAFLVEMEKQSCDWSPSINGLTTQIPPQWTQTRESPGTGVYCHRVKWPRTAFQRKQSQGVL